MCLLLFAHGTHPRYRLVVAANRDEQHARPTAPDAELPDTGVGGHGRAFSFVMQPRG